MRGEVVDSDLVLSVTLRANVFDIEGSLKFKVCGIV